MPLRPLLAQTPFEKWVIDFIGPIDPSEKHSEARFIITRVEYLTKWAEVEPTKDCTTNIATRFLYENIINRYGCPLSIVSDQWKHVVKKMIKKILQSFMITHKRSSPYHPQANGASEALKKIVGKDLTKMYDRNRMDWDIKVTRVQWEYHSSYKRTDKFNTFQLVYGIHTTVPMNFIIPKIVLHSPCSWKMTNPWCNGQNIQINQMSINKFKCITTKLSDRGRRHDMI